MNRILVYHVGGIGDTLVALPAFRMLKANFPDAEFDLLNLAAVNSRTHAQIYGNTDLFARKTFLMPASRPVLYLQFARAFFSRRYDAFYSFSFSDAPPVSLAAMCRVRGCKVFHCAPHRDFPELTIAEGYLRMLEKTGLKHPGDITFELPLTEQEIQLAVSVRKQLPDAPPIAFGTGGNQSACVWPVERYAEVISWLKKRHDFTPVFIGGESDRTAAETLIAQHGGIFLADTACRGVRETVAFLRLCRGYAGNDTGSIHLAAAAGIPCLGIYSAHNLPAARWLPNCPDRLVLRHDPECAGCERHDCPKGTPPPCLLNITADEILDAAERLLFAK